MRLLLAILSALCLGLPASAAPAPTASSAPPDSFRRAALREGWPDSREGELASLWVRAFSTGEAAMRDFNSKHYSRESLAKKGLDERAISYRKLRERLGRLSLAGVVKSVPGELTVKLFDSEAEPHEFVFTVEKSAPFKLVSVAMKEQHGLHGMFGH